jgi:hypothetical protein
MKYSESTKENTRQRLQFLDTSFIVFLIKPVQMTGVVTLNHADLGCKVVVELVFMWDACPERNLAAAGKEIRFKMFLNPFQRTCCMESE